MAHGDDEGRDPFGGGAATRGFDPDPVGTARGPVAFKSVPAADRANGVIDKVISELKKLGDEVSKLSKKLGTTAGASVGTAMSGMGSYTSQHITGAAGKLTQSWRGLYTDPGSGYVDEAARIMAYQQGAQIIGQVGGGLNRYFSGAGGGQSVLDWAATQRSQLYGTYQERNRESYNRRQSGIMGFTSTADLAQGSMLNNRISGGSFSGLQQLGRGAQLNPTLGLAGTASAYQQLLQPSALAGMVPFGGGAVANGGQRRQFDQMLEHYALTATGTQRFGQGGLTQKFARATFSEGGQGRQNLRALGMSEDMIDMVMQYSGQSAAAGRALNLDSGRDSKVFRGSVLENQANRARRGTQTDTRIFEDSRDAQMNWNDLMGRANQELGKFIDNVGAASSLFGAGKVGGALQSLSQVGMLGLMLRGGGGGLGGLGGAVSGAMGAGGIGGGLATAGMAGLAGLGGYAVGSALGKAVPGHGRASGAARGALKYGAAGAGIGAVIGTPFFGVGAGVGAAIGGGIGALGGGLAGAFGIGDAVLQGPGKTSGLKGDFLKRLEAMFAENPRLSLTSGFRSHSEQERLYSNRGSNPYPVARPGTSRHESGVAADVGPNSELGWVHANAARFGLSIPLPDKDPVHIEMAGATPQVQGGSTTVDDLVGGTGGGMVYSAQAGGGLYGGSAGSSLAGVLRSGFSPVKFMGGSVQLDGGGLVSGSSGGGSGLLAKLRARGLSGERLRIAYAVGMAESKGNPNAWKNDQVEDSRGWFQVNVDGRTGWGRSRAKKYGNLFDPDNNVNAMMDISGGGSNWNAWSTFKSGAYKKYMDPGIGDAVVGGRSGMSVASSRTLVLQNLHLNVKIDQVSEQEARRLGFMFLDFLAQQQAMDKMGTE